MGELVLRRRAWPDPPAGPSDNPSPWVHYAGSATSGSRPPLRGLSNAAVTQSRRLLGQVLGHQDLFQVTRARAAWPLRLGWKKSRALTWLAVNW